MNPIFHGKEDKPCQRCGEIDRYTSGACRPCQKEYAAAYEKSHRDERKAASARWRKANPERAKEMHAKYRAENPGKEKASGDRWHVEHPDSVKKANAKYRAKHHGKVKEACDKWKAEHPENMRATWHKRRIQEKNAGGSFTVADIRALLKRQKEKCVVCRTDISKSYHIDHVMPLSLGGSNDIWNIQLLCPFCNLSKKNKHPIAFMQSRGFLL